MPVPKPTQARAVATRARLIDATVACLVEHGLAGASTPVIARAAEVSQGALFKHFASKAELLAAALEQVLARLVTEFQDQLTPRKRFQASVEAACGVLWEIFREPEMRAVFEVYIAARTDPELAALLAPILRQHRAAILTEARRLFPVAPRAAADLDAAVDVIVNAMQGAAIALFAGDHAAEEEQLASLRRFACRELERIR